MGMIKILPIVKQKTPSKNINSVQKNINTAIFESIFVFMTTAKKALVGQKTWEAKSRLHVSNVNGFVSPLFCSVHIHCLHSTVFTL